MTKSDRYIDMNEFHGIYKIPKIKIVLKTICNKFYTGNELAVTQTANSGHTTRTKTYIYLYLKLAYKYLKLYNLEKQKNTFNAIYIYCEQSKWKQKNRFKMNRYTKNLHTFFMVRNYVA